jgi:hypothetical protein
MKPYPFCELTRLVCTKAQNAFRLLSKQLRQLHRHSRRALRLPCHAALRKRSRQFLRLAAVAAALPAVSHSAGAQPYPTRPVRILVGLSAGGIVDLLARLIIIGQSLSERLGQQFIVENRLGAAGNIAAEAVVRGVRASVRRLLGPACAT